MPTGSSPSSDQDKRASCPGARVYLCKDEGALITGGPIPRAIMSTLERFKRVQRPGETPKEVFFGRDNFRPTVDKWPTVPIVYGLQHPNPFTLSSSPEAALAEVGGRIAGYPGPVVIPEAGEPRLEGDLPFTDEQVKGLWEKGLLALSIGFVGDEEPMPGLPGKYRLKGPVYPNHILVFPRSPVDQPADGGAVFLNKKEFSGAKMTDADGTKINPIDGAISQAVKDTLATYDEKMAFMQKQLDQMRAVNAEKDEMLAIKENALREFSQKAKDAEWDQLAAQLPRGLVFGQKAIESREEFYRNPAAFMMKTLSIIEKQHSEQMEKAGQVYLQKVDKGIAKAADFCTGIKVNGLPVTDQEA